MKLYRIIIPLIAAVLISGCAVFRPARELEIIPAEKTNQIRDLLSGIETQNASLNNFKGIGNLQIRQNNRLRLDERVAWIGEKPVKFSIAVLISGYPVVKMATDGEWLYYLEVHGQDTTFRKFPASDPSLKKLISIPISASDVITLLAGQIPMPQFDSAVLTEEETPPGYVLDLKEKWWGIRQKIYYDRSFSKVHRIDVFQRSGTLKYRAEIENRQSINGFQVPLRLRLITSDGADCLLSIERYWANVDVPPTVFVLTPPD
jgi:hypothetical protein